MATTVQPVLALHGLVTLLDTVVVSTLAHPDETKHIHHLRTTIRRIEAQLELLSLLPVLPGSDEQAVKVRKLLRKLRRSTGHVRDLDVQCNLIRSRSKEAEWLRDKLKHQRRQAGKDLVHLLRRNQAALAHKLKSLLEISASTESFAISSTRMAELSRDWYLQQVPAVVQDFRQLHSIRKAAKTARYMAESSLLSKPGTQAASTALRRLARALESIQHAGGEWHDWAMLADITHSRLGPASPLAQSSRRHCEESLEVYRQRLKSIPKNLQG